MSQKGFTLVELAIVLMIIGLLIGGILKGQELIQNARVVTFAQQIQGYRGAIVTFQDSYGALPGDMTGPSTRLPNCTAAPCSQAGDGNGRIGNTASVSSPTFSYTQATEPGGFWVHLISANIVSGSNYGLKSATNGDVIAAMASSFKTDLMIGYMSSAATGNYPAFSGHYFLSKPILGIASAAPTSGGGGNYFLSGMDAARIDRKMDDGKPYTGDVMGISSNADCLSGTEYSALTTRACNMLIGLGM